MPTLFLKHRQPHLSERMDDAHCDRDKLFNTYAQFKYINGVISGWRRVYRRWLRPHLVHGPATLLDIGCGGGDLLESLARWTKRDGLDVEITGIEPDQRAVQYLAERPLPGNVKVRNALSSQLAAEGLKYDVVISNHVVHHLGTDELNRFLADCERLTSRLALHNDIRRDDLAYIGFIPTRAVFWNSFITIDGLTSIRRSYLPEELASVVPAEWRVHPMALFRNLLVWEP